MTVMMILWWNGISCADCDGCSIFGQLRPSLNTFSSSSPTVQGPICWGLICRGPTWLEDWESLFGRGSFKWENTWWPLYNFFFIHGLSLKTGVNIWSRAVSIAFVESSYCDAYQCPKVQKMPTVHMVKWSSGWRCTPPLSRLCEALWIRVTALNLQYLLYLLYSRYWLYLLYFYTTANLGEKNVCTVLHCPQSLCISMHCILLYNRLYIALYINSTVQSWGDSTHHCWIECTPWQVAVQSCLWGGWGLVWGLGAWTNRGWISGVWRRAFSLLPCWCRLKKTKKNYLKKHNISATAACKKLLWAFSLNTPHSKYS